MTPHQLARRLFGDDVDKVGRVLYYELEQRHGVGNVVKSIENDPSFTLGVECGILAALDKLARMGVITEGGKLTDAEAGLLVHMLDERIRDAEDAGVPREDSSTVFKIRLLEKLQKSIGAAS